MLQAKSDEIVFGSRDKVKGRSVKGLAENIKGKSGRFRQNLLGKRVDYSGRAVIVSGPELAKDQAGIPIKSYLEMMKPTVIGLLCVQGHAGSFHAANTMIKDGDWIVWDILQMLANENFIILNRAPTLHRLGIMAFRIVLTDNSAISLHPLTCKAFNADFDGDQMGMHVPITLEAKIECRVLLLYSNNIINVANGEIIITPRKDVVLGLYYLTLDMPGEECTSDCRSFYSYRDVEVAVENKLIKYDTKIKYYFKYSASEIKEERERVRSIITTQGRIKMFNLLPNDGKMKFEDWNFAFGMEQVTAITKKIYEVYGNAATVEFCDQIMYLGFKSATHSAISISIADLKVPDSKKNYISKAIEDLLKIEEQYKDGVITTKEKENKITDIWSKASNLIGEDLKKEITKNDSNRNINSLSLMMKSGSRVSMIQLLQICGMKGLVTTASLGVIYTAVISSYVEGLNLIEFFISAYGARKGNVDSALKTPFTGYFARKLATVAQSCVIVNHNCGTKNGILYEAKNFDFKQGDHFLNIALGRVLAEDIIKDGEVLFKFGQVVDKDIVEKLKTINLKSIKLKSPVTCEEHFGICSECYGYDIATNKLCAVGTAVGIIAAQSIGEPGTQLTLRTFHSGGATSKTDTSFNLSAPFDSVITFKEDQMIKIEDCSIFIGHSLVVDFTFATGVSSFSLSHGSKIFVKSGQAVKNKDKIAEWDPYNSAIFAEEDGVVKFEDLVRQLSYTEIFDEATGRSSKIVINWLENAKNLRPNILLVDKAGYALKNSHNFTSKYYLSAGMIIMRQEGEEVKKGDILVRTPKDVIGFQKDITGGLPRVEELFEARIPESCSVISPCTGRLELLDSSSSKNKIILHSATDDKTYNFSVPKNKCILFKNGSFVHKGDIICEGNVNPHDLLVAQGVDGLVNYLTTEILKVYSLQGVVIQLKHLEVIIRYMLRKVSISSIGEADGSNFNVGDLCFMTRIEEENLKLQKDNKRPIESSRVLEGVTKASLSTESFIEAATFQEPMRILTEAAFLAKKDPLIGVKENLVIGSLTPIGTGISIRNICSEL
jgi:DNA-directed RNA polymerase subunit beta'